VEVGTGGGQAGGTYRSPWSPARFLPPPTLTVALMPSLVRGKGKGEFRQGDIKEERREETHMEGRGETAGERTQQANYRVGSTQGAERRG